MQRFARLSTPLALAAVYLIWGSTYFVLHVALESFPPMLLAAIRFSVAGATLYAICRARGAAAPTLAQWVRVVAIAAVLLVGGHGGVVYAQQWVESGLAAVMTSTVPLWAAFLGGLLGRGWPGGRERAGILVGFAGAAILALGGPLGARGPGALVLAVAPALWALGSMLGQRWDVPKGLLGSATTMLAAGPLFLVLGLLRGETLGTAPSGRSVLALAYLTVLGSLVAFSAYQHLLASTRPAVATSYAYVNPVLAVALGSLLGAERFGAIEAAAMAITLAGVVLLTSSAWRGGPRPIAAGTASPHERRTPGAGAALPPRARRWSARSRSAA